MSNLENSNELGRPEFRETLRPRIAFENGEPLVVSYVRLDRIPEPEEIVGFVDINGEHWVVQMHLDDIKRNIKDGKYQISQWAYKLEDGRFAIGDIPQGKGAEGSE